MPYRIVYDSHLMLHPSTHSQLSKYTHEWLNHHYEEISEAGRITEGGKLLAYILDAETLSVKDVLEFDTFSFKTDTEFKNKSTFVTDRMPNVSHDDYAICKCGGSTVFVGIVQDFASDSDSYAYTLTLTQKECMFDRFIFPENESLLQTDGIEDFIGQAITSNWISSGDAMLDRTYMSVTAATHTTINAHLSSIVKLTDGAYNLKTFLGNVLEYYKVYLDFIFSGDGSLNIIIYADAQPTIAVDVSVTDVSGYDETYSVDALTKLNVKWDQTDGQDVIATYYRTYYLLADRTITQDGTDPDRAIGTTKAMTIEAETEPEMYEEVVNEFTGNSYKHKIAFALYMDSKVYDYRDLYIGRSTQIKTKSGIRTSLVTAFEMTNSSRFASITFGKLKVTLIEKIRGMDND